MLAGGYTAQREPTKSEIAIFSEAISGQDISALLGEVPFDLSSLEPVSVATQVVAGTNYMVLFRKVTVTAEPVNGWAMATVYVAPDGSASVTDMQDVVLSISED